MPEINEDDIDLQLSSFGVLKVSIPKSQVEKQKVKKLSVKKPKKLQN